MDTKMLDYICKNIDRQRCWVLVGGVIIFALWRKVCKMDTRIKALEYRTEGESE